MTNGLHNNNDYGKDFTHGFNTQNYPKLQASLGTQPENTHGIQRQTQPNPYPWIFSGRVIPMGTHGRRVPMGTQGNYPKKSKGMGWVGFVSEFHGYFRVGYPKKLVILGSFGYQTRG